MTVHLKPLREQTIVVTGASSGIGLATAFQAASRGAAVVLAARNGAALQEATNRIKNAGGRAAYVVADVGAEPDIKGIVKVAESTFGGFDTWVNNAGVGAYATLITLPIEEHERIFRTNYWGVVFGSRAAVAHLRDRPGGGALINIGSVNSDFAIPLLSAYSASKHAVKGFTEALRTELMHDRLPISVTLIKPSGIATPFPQHARNYLPTEPRVAPPLYAPELVADAILHAAQQPVRDMTIGAGGRMIAAVAAAMPSVMDRLIGRFGPAAQTTSKPRTMADNLKVPASDGQVHSPFSQGRGFSAYTAAQKAPTAALGLVLVVGSLAVRTLGLRRRR